MEETKIYNQNEFSDLIVENTLHEVVDLLKVRGYDPINQIVGYLLSGDPGYISSYKDARKKMTSVDRTKILEVLVREYIK
ncbi:MAG: IreB family regulatory phosphoprotein [Bacilli bacterium]|nr:IreB family regulatory phosphoprotein [Bacilli bacterium]